MHLIPAYQALDSNERGTILGGTDEFYRLMEAEMEHIRGEVMALGEYHHRQHALKMHKCKAPGCLNEFPGCKNIVYCSDHRNGRGIHREPPGLRANVHKWSKDDEILLWDMSKKDMTMDELAKSMPFRATACSVATRLSQIREEKGIKRKYKI
jgi:hypothetical protein